MLSLKELQEQQKEWVLRNFGNRPPWQPLLGLSEEVGEISHSYLKWQQGIRGTPDEHMAAIADGCADLIIFLADFATSMGIDLESELEKVWNEVKKRDWKRFPKNGKNE